jgi:hypothetical protein
LLMTRLRKRCGFVSRRQWKHLPMCPCFAFIKYKCIYIQMHLHSFKYKCIYIHSNTNASTFIQIQMHLHSFKYKCIYIHVSMCLQALRVLGFELHALRLRFSGLGFRGLGLGLRWTRGGACLGQCTQAYEIPGSRLKGSGFKVQSWELWVFGVWTEQRGRRIQ